jgi:hypothetical protein
VTTAESERAASSTGDLEALIEEARARQRRRRRRVALAVLLAGGGAIGSLLASRGGDVHRGSAPTAASPGAIRAFLAEARRGAGSAFSGSYRLAVRYSSVLTRSLEIRVEQRSSDLFSYQETPSFFLSESGTPISHSYAVFLGIHGPPGPQGTYACAQARRLSRWSCLGPYTDIGMSGNEELLGPYPPQALLLGLENAVAAYTGGVLIAPPVHREPASLVQARHAGQSVRCLRFGPSAHTVGEACLDSDGVIAYYDIPQNVTSGAWRQATLLSYSHRVPGDAFKLPAAPTRSGVGIPLARSDRTQRATQGG